MINSIKVNKEQRLYVISSGNGFTCLGFDVCYNRVMKMQEHYSLQDNIPRKGSKELYTHYKNLVQFAKDQYNATKKICPTELHPQLIGLEGKRVEVLDQDDEKHRFYVSRSSGWIPCHIEVKRSDSSGGCAVDSRPFKRVTVIN